MSKRVITSLPELLEHIRYRDGRMKAAVVDATVQGIKHVVQIMGKTTAFEDQSGAMREAIDAGLISVKVTDTEVVGSLSIGRKLAYTRPLKALRDFTSEGLSRYGAAFEAAANGRLEQLSTELS